jgi:hypothetical protein
MIDWDEYSLPEYAPVEPEPVVEKMVWIFRPGKNIRGTAFLALVTSDKLNKDGTIQYAGEVCEWREFKP